MTLALPSPREEDWRWADLAFAHALADTSPPANDPLPDVAGHWLDLDGERRLFVAGRPVEADIAAPEADPAAPAHPLADHAAAVARAGTTLRVDGEGGLLQLLHVGTGGAAHGVTRVVLAPGAHLTLIETFADADGDHWLNHRFDADLGEGAVLNRIVRVRHDHGLVTDRAFARIAATARYHQLLVGMGQGVLRAETHAWLSGAGAHADVHGILLGNHSSAQDILTRAVHRSPNATSDQKWRLVAAEQAKLSIAGGVMVAQDAQKTNAEQSLKALVFHRTASANLKPELEIFADDVKCAHGCTVGALDKAALFYLESRGVPPAEAKVLLTRAFVADALGAVDHEKLASLLDAETQAWLATAAEKRA
ncbi:MAG: SufD family Fe-S cluster assembly protein [Sphingomonadaceae bacterium]